MKKPTIEDVAKESGFSKSTVSAVLNYSATVSDSTRARILAVMDELNYRPGTGVRNGSGDGTAKTLGLVIKEAANPYYASIIAGAREFAETKGYVIHIGTSGGDSASERRVVEAFRSKNADGLIIIPVLSEDADLSYVFDLHRRNIPYVLLEGVRGIQASVIDVDNVEASRIATKYFIDQGHTRILHFTGPSYSLHSEERLEGFRRAFSASSLAFAEDMVVPTGAYLADGYRKGKEVFGDADEQATAVTCYNDLVAIGLLRALHELGTEVPNQVSVIGYDDIEVSQYLHIPLSSVHVPKYEMGQKAAQLLIEQIEARKKLPPQKINLKARLVLRATTRPD